MAFNAGSVTVKIDADNKGFEKGISDSKGKLTGFVAGVSKFALKSVAAFGAAGVAAAGFALKSASDMQTLRTNLDTLTGSAEKGAEMFKFLNEFSAKTPFEQKDLASATETMLSFGISSEQVRKDLQVLGDVSLGNKNKLQGLSLAFAQVQSTGRLMGQDLLQMINQGFNPLRAIAQENIGKKLGLSFKEAGEAIKSGAISAEDMSNETSRLKDEMAKGAISADSVRNAFVNVTQEGGLFFQGMEKGSQTFEGRIATLKDNIGILARKIIGLSETGDVIKGGLFDKFSLGLNFIIEWVNSHQDQILQFFMDIGGFLNTYVAPAIAFVIEIFKKWGSIVDYFKQLWERFGPMIMGILGALANDVRSNMVPAFQMLVESLRPYLPYFIDLLKVIGVLLGAFIVGSVVILSKAITGLMVLISLMLQGLQRGAHELKVAFQAIYNFISPVISLMGTLLKYIAKVADVAFPIGKLASQIKSITGRAIGGVVAPGELTMVGERGPELVRLPAGSRVYNSQQSNRMAAESQGNFTVNFGDVTVRSESDIQAIADKVASVIGRRAELESLGIRT